MKDYGTVMKSTLNSKGILLLLIVLTGCAFFPHSGRAVTMGQFTTVAKFKNGSESGQLKWLVTDGYVDDGFMHGPTAFLAVSGGRLFIADTLNLRICACAPDGKVQKIIDLKDVQKAAALEETPRIIDLVMYPPDVLYLADAISNRVIAVSEKGEFIRLIGKTGTGPGEFRQINKIHTSEAGTIYVEDVSQARTIAYDKNGSFLTAYRGLTFTAVDGFGNLHQILFKGDLKSRDIVVYDENGNLAETLGTITSEKDIKYVKPVGFDFSGNFHVTFDTDSARYYVAFDPDGTIVSTIITELLFEGLHVTTPDWVSPDGDIYAVQVEAEKLSIFKLVPVEE